MREIFVLLWDNNNMNKCMKVGRVFGREFPDMVVCSLLGKPRAGAEKGRILDGFSRGILILWLRGILSVNVKSPY